MDNQFSDQQKQKNNDKEENQTRNFINFLQNCIFKLSKQDNKIFAFNFTHLTFNDFFLFLFSSEINISR